MCLGSASPFVLRWSLRTIASDVASYRFRGLIVRILFSRKSNAEFVSHTVV